jgi:hypothetical protein
VSVQIKGISNDEIDWKESSWEGKIVSAKLCYQRNAVVALLLVLLPNFEVFEISPRSGTLLSC